MTRKILSAGFFAVLIAFATRTSEAALQLRIEDMSTNQGVVISDGGALDADARDGVVRFEGQIGQFDIELTTLKSKPLLPLGGRSYSEMTLQDWNVNNSGNSGSLRIIAQDTDFEGGPDSTTLGFNSSFSGLLIDGATSITSQSYLNPDNNGLSLGTDQAGVLPFVNTSLRIGDVEGMNQTFTGSPFTGKDSSDFIKNGDYAMFAIVTVNFSGEGYALYNLNLQTVPEPSGIATWALLGMVSAGGLVFGRMRKLRK